MSTPGLNRLSYIDTLKVLAAFMIVRGMMWHRTRSDFRRMKRKMAEIEAVVLK